VRNAAVPAAPAALANDNRTPAGELKDGVLTLRLDLVPTSWYPAQDDGRSFPVYAFAEKGKPPQIPGPLIRVPQGSEVRLELHNTLTMPMFVLGFQTTEPVTIAPGGTAKFQFAAKTPGTFYYSARSCKHSIREVGLLDLAADLPMGENPFEMESQLKATIILDSSKSMDFGDGKMTKLSYGSYMAATIAYLAELARQAHLRQRRPGWQLAGEDPLAEDRDHLLVDTCKMDRLGHPGFEDHGAEVAQRVVGGRQRGIDGNLASGDHRARQAYPRAAAGNMSRMRLAPGQRAEQDEGEHAPDGGALPLPVEAGPLRHRDSPRPLDAHISPSAGGILGQQKK
jgi:hypothetical protein